MNVIENTLELMAKKLPAPFRSPLTSPILKQLMYEFHSASYVVLNDTVTFLVIVINHLMKTLEGTDEDIKLEEKSLFI